MNKKFLCILLVLGISILTVPVDRSGERSICSEDQETDDGNIQWYYPIAIVNDTVDDSRPTISFDGYKYHVVYAHEYSSYDNDIIDCRSDDYYSGSTTHLISSSPENDKDPHVVYYHGGKELWSFWSNNQTDIWYKVSYDGGSSWDGPWDIEPLENEDDGKIDASSNPAYPSKVYTSFVIPANKDYTTDYKYVAYELYESGNGQGWYDVYSFTYDGTNPSRVSDVSSLIGNDGFVYSFWLREKDCGGSLNYSIEYRKGSVSSSPISWGPVETVMSRSNNQHRTNFCTAYDDVSENMYLFYTRENGSMVDIAYRISTDHGSTWSSSFFTGVSLKLNADEDVGIDALINDTPNGRMVGLTWEDGQNDIIYMEGEIMNSPPSYHDPIPSDGSEGAGTNVSLSVNVNDADADLLSVTFYNASSGGVIGTESGVVPGSRVSVNWTGLAHGKEYSWYVEVDDGKDSSTSARWNFTTLYLQRIGLFYESQADGWNFVSSRLIPDDGNISALLDGVVEGNHEEIMWYDAAECTWKTYLDGRASRYNTIDSLNRSMGIWIRVSSDDVLRIEGTRPEETTVVLHPGWNMVGYPSETNRIASDVLPSEVNKIGVFNKWATYDIEYVSDLSSEVMVTGRGYWVYNGEDHDVNYTVVY